LYRVVILAQAQVSPHHLVIGSDVLPAMSIQYWGPTMVKLAIGGLALASCCSAAGIWLDEYFRHLAVWRWTFGLYMMLDRRERDLYRHVARRQPEPLHEDRAVRFAADIAMEMGRRHTSDV
jgi:hypothetical protein